MDNNGRIFSILLALATLQSPCYSRGRRKTDKDFISHINDYSRGFIICFADLARHIMSKKTIISDFSALKGKVTLSEVTDIQISVKKKAVAPASEPQPKSKDTQLKAGQSVVLMDSDLRGKIISLGRRVCIKLEDGLIIEAAYGEFAVTDDTELEALKCSRIKHEKKATAGTPRPKQKPAKGMLEVDLHIEALPGGNCVPKEHRLQFQMGTFRSVIRENLSHKGMKICFIHGVGDGILKAEIRKELDEVLALRCTYTIGDPAVTVVTIR